MDDCIIFDSDIRGTQHAYDFLRARYNITDKGATVEEFLGINMDHYSTEGREYIHMS